MLHLRACLASYAPPVVLRVWGPGASGASTEGGQVVLVGGASFGPVALNGVTRVTYGPDGTGYTAQCTVAVDDVQLSCVTAPGVGAGHAWVVVVGQQSAPVFAANSSYGAPVVAYLVSTVGVCVRLCAWRLFGRGS
jgi:hypothetical protein